MAASGTLPFLILENEKLEAVQRNGNATEIDTVDFSRLPYSTAVAKAQREK